MFVTVEGIEGCGKSTLLAGLSERLRERGAEIIVTREPGGTAVGDAVRDVFLKLSLKPAALTEAYLINAARAQHVVELIAPGLARGATVLCDRFVDSTLAYQGYGRGVDLDLLRDLSMVATGGLTPDLTLVLDIPVAISRERIATRPGHIDRMETEDDAFYVCVRHGFLELASAGGRYRVLDGTRSPEDLVAAALHEILNFTS
ncbi:MAG: dTMP kinase [Candidatus Eremiobacteraeota bacterium]|nr:dTMP kinase [Candidatus Eremiobacteraeota bacterium]